MCKCNVLIKILCGRFHDHIQRKIEFQTQILGIYSRKLNTTNQTLKGFDLLHLLEIVLMVPRLQDISIITHALYSAPCLMNYSIQFLSRLF
jgi:hypothetical protein